MELGVKARAYITFLGSKLIKELKYRDSWAFISWQKNSVAEAYQKTVVSKPGENWGEPARLKGRFTLLEKDEDLCEWNDENDHEEERFRRKRKSFCSKFDGYAKVCDCKYTFFL